MGPGEMHEMHVVCEPSGQCAVSMRSCVHIYNLSSCFIVDRREQTGKKLGNDYDCTSIWRQRLSAHVSCMRAHFFVFGFHYVSLAVAHAKKPARRSCTPRYFAFAAVIFPILFLLIAYYYWFVLYALPLRHVPHPTGPAHIEYAHPAK